MSKFDNGYGHFSDDGLEYVITNATTPMPWVNVICNGDYGMVLSEAGSGYSWRTHASLNRITRWDQDLIRDEWGKYLFVRDADSGEFWSLSRQPAGEKLQRHTVRHGLGYSVIAAEQDGIASEVTYTVPQGAPCELWLVTLSNTGTAPRRLQLFSYFEWLCGSAPDWHREFHRLFITTEYDEAAGAILVEKVFWDLPGGQGPHWNRDWPYVGFHAARPHPVGFDTYKGEFIGRNSPLSAPRALETGQSRGTEGRFGDPIGSLQMELVIEPGASTVAVFVLGAADTRAEAISLVERYATPDAVRATLDETRTMWHGILDRLRLDTPDEAFNLMGNVWLPYQAIACRLWARTAYYQTGGAYGYRDQLQDSLVWLLLGKPEKTLDQIRLHARHQYTDGVVMHWWHPLAEEGYRSGYSDDLLWLPFVTLYYLLETGDFAALEEDVPFLDEGSGTLLDHCLRAFNHSLGRRSPRGLPLIGAADWNDGLNAVGYAGRGESVWMAHFLHFLLREWSELPVLGSSDRERFMREAATLHEVANTHGWDGDWYLRATTDDGALLGSATNQEGRIFLNAQTWAILGGTATAEHGEKAMAAAREHLFADFGPLLLAPAYSVPDPSVGYLTRYAPGTRENGGLYTHAGCWAILAERMASGADGAYTLWRSFCPVLRGMDPDAYMAEPYVTPGNVDGPTSGLPGRGGWTWYTGSAQWYLRAMIDGVLGVTVTLDGLRVDPQLPADWSGFSLTRQYRGATYEIMVHRATAGDSPTATLNGAPWTGSVLPVAPAGSVQRVELSI